MHAPALTRRRRVLIVDDHRMFVDGLTLLLAGHEEIELIGSCATAEEALRECTRLHPDVVLLDVDLPGIGGIEATALIAERFPQVVVVIISAYKDGKTIADCLRAGARGFVPKTHAADEIAQALREVSAGKIALSSRHAAEVLGELNVLPGMEPDIERIRASLTPREWEILEMLAQGSSTEAIATTLFISPFTVRGHVRGLLSKLQVHSKMEAVSFAYRHRLIPRST